jgi:hypothetical protein
MVPNETLLRDDLITAEIASDSFLYYQFDNG